MKKIILVTYSLLTVLLSVAQNNIGIGTNTPNSSAALDITSTAKGLLIPRMTSAQRTAIASPAKGLLVFDNTTSSFWFFNGSSWADLSESSNSFSLPYSDSLNMGSPAFKIKNDGMGPAIEGTSANEYGYAVSAKTTGGSGWGLFASSKGKNSIAVNAFSDSGTVISAANTNANNTNNVMSITNAGKGAAVAVNVTNPNNDKPILTMNSNGLSTGVILQMTNQESNGHGMYIGNAGRGDGIKIDLTTPNEYARSGVHVNHKGFGTGVFSSATNGNGVWGITDSSNYDGVYGVNNQNGVGVHGFTREGGISIYGEAGFMGYSGIAGKFENTNPSSSKEVVNITSNAANTGLLISGNSTGSAPQILLDEKTSNDFARIKMKNPDGGYWDIAGKPSTNANNAYFNIFFNNGLSGTDKFSLSGNGNLWIAGTLSENSDARLKKDITLIRNPAGLLQQLSGYHYYWKDANRDSRLQTGLIAQEVEKVFPELVSQDEKGIKSVNYNGLIPYLLEAVKSLQQQVDELNAKK